MIKEAAIHSTKPNVSAKSIALPVEHGAWGFLFEPLAAGILLAPSAATFWIVLMVVGAFLMRQPLRFLIPDWLGGKNLPRTALALKYSVIFASLFAVGAIGSFAFAPIESFIPFLAIAPLAIYQIYSDAVRKSRQLLPELTGAIALSSSVTVLALAGGWNAPTAFSLWAIMLARLIPSILYVRSRLRLEKGKETRILPPIAAHVLALISVAALAYFGLSPILLVLMITFLLGRSVYGLSSLRKPTKAKFIGIQEVIFGSLTMLGLVFGYYLGI